MRLVDAEQLFCSDCEYKDNCKNVACDVKTMPAVDAVPVVHGRWLPVDEKNDAFDCSECDAMVQKRCNYCPNCGAKMGLEG